MFRGIDPRALESTPNWVSIVKKETSTMKNRANTDRTPNPVQANKFQLPLELVKSSNNFMSRKSHIKSPETRAKESTAKGNNTTPLPSEAQMTQSRQRSLEQGAGDSQTLHQSQHNRKAQEFNQDLAEFLTEFKLNNSALLKHKHSVDKERLSHKSGFGTERNNSPSIYGEQDLLGEVKGDLLLQLEKLGSSRRLPNNMAPINKPEGTRSVMSYAELQN